MPDLHVVIPSPPGRAPRQHLDAEVLVAWARERGFGATAFDPAVSSGSLAAELTGEKERASVVYCHVPSAAELQPLEEAVAGLDDRSEGGTLRIAGGAFAQTHDREVLNRVPALDGVVRGEAELPVLDLLEAVARDDGSWVSTGGLTVRDGDDVQRNPMRRPGVDPGRIPQAAADLFHPDRRLQGQQVLLGRGCNSDCSYCGLQTVYRRSFSGRTDFWRGRPAAAVADEIEFYARAHGVAFFHLYAFVTLGYDDAGAEQVRGIADELVRRDLGIRFGFVTHPGHLVRNRELLPRLRRAGLASVSLGLDSGSPSVLDRLRVPFRLEDSEAALRLLHEQEIPFQPQLIFYEPRMSLDEVEENLAFLRRIAPWFLHLPQPYSLFLCRDLLARPLLVNHQAPVHEELWEDGLWDPPESITGRGRSHFRHRRVERFFRGHQMILRDVVRESGGALFDPQRCAENPDLALLPLDLLDRWLEIVRADDPPDEDAAPRLSAWARCRLESSSSTDAPLRVAGTRG
jgi:hypothetical protein